MPEIVYTGPEENIYFQRQDLSKGQPVLVSDEQAEAMIASGAWVAAEDYEADSGEEEESGGNPFASDAAAEAAAEAGLDPEEIEGTGSGGKITKADVEAAAAAGAEE